MKHIHKIFNKHFAAVFISLACTSLLIGCGAGSGQGLDESGNLLTASSGVEDTTGGDTTGGNTGGSLSGNPNATLAWLQNNVFGGVCSQCHTGAGAPLGVNWSSESNTCSNVGNASGENNSLMEVDSGRPDQSYVIWKVQGAGPNGEAIVAAQMPLNNPPLSAEAIQNMRDWISDGTPGCTTSNATAAMKANRSESTITSNSRSYPVGSWMHVWNESLRTCSLCHSLTPSSPRCSVDLECPPNGIVLSADNYYGVVDGNTVAPFDLDRSILWNRVNEVDPETRMPLGFNDLTTTQLDILRNWIEGGARYCPQNMICP
jgi:hypothetical protein